MPNKASTRDGPDRRPTATILAGGLSRRMFAASPPDAGPIVDKGLLPLGDISMIEHVIAVVRPQSRAIVLNANGNPARFAALNLPVVPDPIDGFVGPLAGVLAGMRWTATNHPTATHTLSVSSDAPFLPDDLASKLAAAVVEQPRAVAIARCNGDLHPVIGLWPVALANDLEAELRSGVRKVLRWTDKHGTVPVDFPMRQIGGRTIDPFFNANTPDELAEARRVLFG